MKIRHSVALDWCPIRNMKLIAATACLSFVRWNILFCVTKNRAGTLAGWYKQPGKVDHVPRGLRQAPRNPETGFGLQLLLDSSDLSQREEPHHVEEFSNDLSEHGWEDLPPRERGNRRHDPRCAYFPSEYAEPSGNTEEEDKNLKIIARLR